MHWKMCFESLPCKGLYKITFVILPKCRQVMVQVALESSSHYPQHIPSPSLFFVTFINTAVRHVKERKKKSLSILKHLTNTEPNSAGEKVTFLLQMTHIACWSTMRSYKSNILRVRVWELLNLIAMTFVVSRLQLWSCYSK